MIEATQSDISTEDAFAKAEAAQRLAADPAHSAWVEANAGSGKTKVLIDRVARLLLQRPDGRPGAEPDSILCITYTKAAANEMLSRLFERLGRWSIQADDELRATLSDLVSRPAESFDQIALNRARSLFARALETPGGLRIETIHAFCARILRRFPLEAGISPGFNELDEDAADELWRECLRSTLERTALEQSDAFKTISDAAGGRGVDYLLDQLRPKRVALQRFQRELQRSGESAETAIQRTLEIGGETPETVVQKAMESDFPRRQILSAIAEIQAAVNPAPDKDKNSKKFAATLQSVIEMSDLERAFEAYLRCLAGSKRDWSLKSNPYSGKRLAQGLTAELFRRKLDAGQAVGSEISRMRRADADYRTARTAQQTIALAQIGLPVVAAYQSAKRRQGGLDFDDLIDTTRSLFVEKAAADWVLYKLDGGLSHILLDEAQDTSPDQWQLINAIAAEFDAGQGASDSRDLRTKFVVGDPKQSIYSFQGADQAAFMQERGRFASAANSDGASAQFPDMTMSFRSTPEVLAFVDAARAIAPLDSADLDRPSARAETIKRHEAKRSDQTGRVELWPLTMPQQIDASEAWDAPVDHLSVDDPPRRLALQIAEEVSSMLARGEAVWQEGPNREWYKRPMTPGDILILVRRRSTLFKTLIASLEAYNLPVAGADRLLLNDSLAVRDCLNLMRFSLQPMDDLTLAEILRGPFCNLVEDDQHLFPLAHNRAPGETLWARLSASEDPSHANARAFCDDLISFRHLGPFEFLSRIMGQTLSGPSTGWNYLIKRFGEPARDPIEELISRALAFDQSEAPSLHKFLLQTDGEPVELKRELGEAGDTIRVMTVHGAKGLQSPIVILPDTTSKTQKTRSTLFFTPEGVPLFSPSSDSDSAATASIRDEENAAQEMESRRLLYVALTRAQDRLIICGAGLRKPESGFEASSWYRWCLQGMEFAFGRELSDSAPAEKQYLGPTVPELGAGSVPKPAAETLPSWLNPPQGPDPRKATVETRRHQDPSKSSSTQLDSAKAAMRRGTLVHSLLHRLIGRPEAEWTSAAESLLNREGSLTDRDRIEIVELSIATLREPEFQPYFLASGRSEVAITGTLPNGRLLSGRVDRLCFLKDRIAIIDFKTGKAPDQESDVEDAYKYQMAAYQHVLTQMYPTSLVSAALLFVEGPRIIALDNDDLSETLNRYANAV